MNPDSAHDRTAGSDPDLDLALRARDGDRAAMEILVTRHHEAVARLLWRFVRTPVDLDDLVQDCFLRMVRGLPDWQPDRPFLHWLLRIATNTGRDWCRRQVVRARWTSDGAALNPCAPAPEAVAPSADPAARLAADEVKLLLAHLPADDRALLTLHYLEGLGLTEIAGRFGWTLTATKLRAWRARCTLRTHLSQLDLA